jgi:hypothetical protein
MGCDATWTCRWVPTYRRDILSPSAGKHKVPPSTMVKDVRFLKQRSDRMYKTKKIYISFALMSKPLFDLNTTLQSKVSLILLHPCEVEGMKDVKFDFARVESLEISASKIQHGLCLTPHV